LQIVPTKKRWFGGKEKKKGQLSTGKLEKKEIKGRGSRNLQKYKKA